MKSIELVIVGMQCEGCVNRIKNVLSTIKGITTYDISLKDKKLLLTVKNVKTIDEVIAKITNLGFAVSK